MNRARVPLIQPSHPRPPASRLAGFPAPVTRLTAKKPRARTRLVVSGHGDAQLGVRLAGLTLELAHAAEEPQDDAVHGDVAAPGHDGMGSSWARRQA